MTTASDRTPPLVDYTATSWRSILDMIERYAQEKYGSGGQVAWTDFNPGNPGSLLFDAMAQVGEMAMFNLNASSRERVATTALRRQSFLDTAKAYDYELLDADQATVDVTVVSDPGALPYTLPMSFKVSNGDADDPVVFQPIADVAITTASQVASFIEGSEVSNELAGTSDGTQFQRIRLSSKPVIRGTLLVLVDGVEWDLYSNYVDMLATTMGYLLEDDEEGYTYLKFGDGINGKVPAISAEIRATYKVGGGSRGQVGANSIQTVVTPIAGVLSVTNVSAAVGGNDAQTVSDGQKALPQSVASMDRAVAIGDYAYQATRVPGVAKAIELPGSVALKEVLLPIAPSGGGTPTSVLKNQVVRYFRTVRPVTFKVVPLNPNYVNVKLAIDLFIKDTYRQPLVLGKAKNTILSLLSFDNMVFGGKIRLQELYHELRSDQYGLEGIDYVVITELTTIPTINIAYGQSNTGNGEVDNLVYTALRQRRTWLIAVDQISPYTGFTVTQRTSGVSTALTTKTLTDSKANWVTNEHVGKKLNPNTAQATTFTITSNTPSSLTITTGDLLSVALSDDAYAIDALDVVYGKVLTTTVDATSASGQKVLNVASTTNFAPGDMVLIRQGTQQEIGVVDTVQAGVSLTLEANLAYTYTSGATVDTFWQATDGTTGFALINGSTPFVIGDRYYYDLYPKLGDIEARSEELPVMLEENLAIRSVGGLS